MAKAPERTITCTFWSSIVLDHIQIIIL